MELAGPAGSPRRTVTLFTYWEHDCVPDGAHVGELIGAIAGAGRGVVTELAPVAYEVVDAPAPFACQPAQRANRTGAGACAPPCDLWSATARRARDAAPGLRTAPVISLPPGWPAAGVEALVRNESRQRSFVAAAVAAMRRGGHGGLWVDWEAGGERAADFAALVARLAGAVHAANGTLSVLGTAATWCFFGTAPDCLRNLAATPADWLMTADTQPAVGAAYDTVLRTAVTAVGDPRRVCVGLDASGNPIPADELRRRLSVAVSLGVTRACVWEDRAADLTAGWWAALRNWTVAG